MPRQSNARERMVTAAAVLFQKQGYNGTGLTQILEVGAAPKGSFYHHFPDGKEGLAEAAVRLSGPGVTLWVEAAFAKAPTFADGVDRLAHGVGDWFRGSGWAAGCPVTSVLMDTAPGSERLRLACREAMDDWAGAVARHAARLGVAGDPQALGLATVVALEGAWVTARARQDTAPFAVAAAMIRALAAQSSSGAPSGK